MSKKALNKYNKPINKEWKKTFKFNNHWFSLKSLFDGDTQLFDFNKAVMSSVNNINFNKLIRNQLKKKHNIITKHMLKELRLKRK